MSGCNEALLNDTQAWENLGPVSQGGTVFGVAISPVAAVSRYWAATGCGVYYSDDGGATWVQTLNGLTTPLLSSLATASNGALLAGSLEGDLFSSFDYGLTWEAGLVPQELKATVTAVLPTPRFPKDGSAFAATDGGGLLVTRNSGRIWEDSSFGLGDSTVLAVVTAPDWSRRETMFAATTEGVFLSLNGGRAWRETELMLSDDVVDVLAISPAFDQDHIVFAGTEKGDIYRSTNGGRTWDLAVANLADGPINCLWVAPDFDTSGCILAAVGSQIHRSCDAGDSWELAADLPGSILSLAGDDQVVLAGLHGQGVYQSTDSGATWSVVAKNFSARGFARLLISDGTFYAMGPQEGIWASSDGQTWSSLPGLDDYLPLTCLTMSEKGELFAASQSKGLLRSEDAGASWTEVCNATGIQAIALTPVDGLGWAGANDGRLWTTRDGGLTWAEAESPWRGLEVLGLAVSPTFAQDRTVLMGTAIPATGNHQARVALWRSTNGGVAWRPVTNQATTARWLDIAIPQDVAENATEHTVVATGPYCLRPLRRAKDVWISIRVDPLGANTLSMVAMGELDNEGVLFAATGNGIFRSLDSGRKWEALPEGIGSQSFISLAIDRQKNQLYALSLGGVLYRRSL